MKTIDPFKKIPNRIGELIEESNKTLKQISQETGINYETLSAYKRQVRTPKEIMQRFYRTILMFQYPI